MWRATTLAVALGLAVPGPIRAEVRPGMMLDQSNADEAKDLLPPEIYEHYKKGEYTNPVVDFPNSKFQWDDGYAEATERNREHLVARRPSKQPVDKDTGKRPDYITGQPFPDIREDDPDAGYKVLWNTIFTRLQRRQQPQRDEPQLDEPHRRRAQRGPGRHLPLLRRAAEAVHPDDQPREPALPVHRADAEPRRPAGHGGARRGATRIPGKRDASWAYVPALRRVRAVSPTNRSDGFLGSDLSQDDGNFFDGKPEDFTWKLVGHREALRFTDPDSLAGKVERQRAAGRRLAHDLHQQRPHGRLPGEGLEGRRLGAGRRRRSPSARSGCIEGVPKDQYYLYGKIELWIDDYTYAGRLEPEVLVAGRAAEHLPDHRAGHGAATTTRSAGGARRSATSAPRTSRRTARRSPGCRPSPDAPNDRRIPLEPSFFDYQTLARSGK